MKKLLIGLAALPLLAGVATAGQPMSLNDAQMDKVTAGQALVLAPVSNSETVTVLNLASFDPPSVAIEFISPEPGGNSAAPLNLQEVVNGIVIVNVGIGALATGTFPPNR
jgi:hypothetical protein